MTGRVLGIDRLAERLLPSADPLAVQALAAEIGVRPLRTFGIAAAGLHADAP